MTADRRTLLGDRLRGGRDLGDRMRKLYAALERLSPKKRAVFVLHELEGMTPRTSPRRCARR